jgi:hypothetical protein
VSAPTDPAGERYELIFGAAKLNLRILDVPVHYQQRKYGASKMDRIFRNGWNMLCFYLLALFRLRWSY